MKIFYFLITVAIFFCNPLYSQWAPIGAKWYYDHYSAAPPYLTVIESIKDTVILTKQCRTLETYEIFSVMDSTGGYHWDTLNCPLQYSYYDSSKVYLLDNIKNSFYLLYDFNAITDDTITVKDSLFQGYCPDSYPSYLFQYKIDIIGDTLINGITLKKQYTSATQNSDWFFSDPPPPYGGLFGHEPIIERIGSLKYLFGVFSAVEGSIKCLRCYQDSNIFYRSPDWPVSLACDYLYQLPTNINETANLQSNIKIFPNPANDYITFQSSMSFYTNPININIYNIIGGIVKSLTFSGKKTEYKMNTLNLNGFYYYVIFSNRTLLKSGTFIVTH
ncbi:MAG: hypothetical protein HXX09_14545 [Bacteroidetes bacterium]|nr:hypothetical protein [Bacteroidota bacterium]